MSTPILMIHYGDSSYLRKTLAGALRSNPGKDIHFLGDNENRHLCPKGVHFHPMAEFASGDALKEFRSIFQPISGKDHRFNKAGGTDAWLRFVFERWFIIESFLESLHIRRFWTFDSDTLIACDLASREERFADFDATEQCRGCCLNGLITSLTVVHQYTAGMLALMKDSGYLDRQRRRLETHTGLAFNEMDAWQTIRDRGRIRTYPLGTPLEGEVFDDALGIPNGYIPASGKIRGRIPLKKVLIDRRGAAWALRAPGADPVRLLTLNLSWMPEFFFDRLFPVCQPLGRLDFIPELCRELSLSEPPLASLRRLLPF